jgi:hypothetical protein
MENKDFTLYPEAFELKQLGFDEPCFAYYKDGRITGVNKWDREDWGFHVITNKDITSVTSEIIIAPTYSQAFRFFRETFGIDSHIKRDYSLREMPKQYCYTIESEDGFEESKNFNTYEEAELACLKKLIEIVKITNNKTNKLKNIIHLYTNTENMTNNKQQTTMKLYTEKDLIKAIAFGFGICHKEDRAPFNKEMIEFIKSLEPTKHIELPSDEDVKKMSKSYIEHVNTIVHKDLERDGYLDIAFLKGATWMRNKIQGDTQ